MIPQHYRQFSFFLIAAIVLLARPATVPAGVIQIETQATVQIKGEAIQVTVKSTNKGTEPAYDLKVFLKLLAKTQTSAMTPLLPPGAAETVLFTSKVADLTPGRYPAIVETIFHDANHFPFSALAGLTFPYQNDSPAELAVSGRDITMAAKGALRFQVKNLGLAERDIKTVLMLPRELSSPNVTASFRLGPRSIKTVNFKIKNFSTLTGAHYPVFCYFEYDGANIHHTAIASADVSIVTPLSWFRRLRWLWFAIIGVLLICLTAILIKNRPRGH